MSCGPSMQIDDFLLFDIVGWKLYSRQEFTRLKRNVPKLFKAPSNPNRCDNVNRGSANYYTYLFRKPNEMRIRKGLSLKEKYTWIREICYLISIWTESDTGTETNIQL